VLVIEETYCESVGVGTVLCSCGTWTPRQNEINRLEAFEMWTSKNAKDILHRVQNNDEVLELPEKQTSLMTTLKQRQKKWLGCVTPLLIMKETN